MVKIMYFWYSKVINKLSSIFYSSLLDAIDLNVYGAIKIVKPNNISIGSRCTINYGVYINAKSKVTIGNNVRLSAGVKIISTGLELNSNGIYIHTSKDVIIGNNVWLGTGVTVLQGVTIGDNIIVGANSLVNKSVTSPGMYVGTPLRKIK